MPATRPGPAREPQPQDTATTSTPTGTSDPHATLSTRPKREQGPHSNVKTSRVRRQGLEPRTRGLRVRCFAFAYYQIIPGGAVLSGTPPISLPPRTSQGHIVPRQPSKHGANMATAMCPSGRYGPQYPLLGRMQGGVPPECRAGDHARQRAGVTRRAVAGRIAAALPRTRRLLPLRRAQQRTRRVDRFRCSARAARRTPRRRTPRSTHRRPAGRSHRPATRKSARDSHAACRAPSPKPARRAPR